MVAKLLRQTKITILLSLNAVVILVVGIMIFSAISLNGGIEFQVVSERSDVVGDALEEVGLLVPGFEELTTPVTVTSDPNDGSMGGVSGGVAYHGSSASSGGTSGGSVGRGQLWAEDAITMYQTADFDICVSDGVGDVGQMYWQTSNPSVIKGFVDKARTWLGYDSTRCRYPVIVGTGTTVITAGTYDGSRHDSITVTVVAPPVEQWKRDVLTLVNQERAKANLAPLAWGTTCEAAANTRARELIQNYAHTRPDGSDWSTACPIPATGGMSGENLAASNAAVSPQTVVASWMNSPEHKKNILNPTFKFLAVGFVFDPNTQLKTYWSQIFSTF